MIQLDYILLQIKKMVFVFFFSSFFKQYKVEFNFNLVLVDSIFLPIVPVFISDGENPSKGIFEDISITMRERAKLNYSMNVN